MNRRDLLKTASALPLLAFVPSIVLRDKHSIPGRPIAISTDGKDMPRGAEQGDLWYDYTSRTVYVWQDNAWIRAGYAAAI